MNVAGQLDVLSVEQMQVVHEKACELLATMELPKGIRLALEKPFGFDELFALFDDGKDAENQEQ